MIEVMIVEDDPMVMEITCKYVESIEGVFVKAKASNGKMALEKLKRIKVDLLILDVYMPEIDGIDLLSKIRKEGNLVDAFFLTAADDVIMIDKALKLGAVDYLIKPFNYERFKTAIDNYKKRYEFLHKGQKVATQSELDSTLGKIAHEENGKIPKGLHSRTLEYIRKYINNSPSQIILADDIAKELSISSVTVRKYMEYLIYTNEVVLQLEYGTVGRPTYKYCKLNKVI